MGAQGDVDLEQTRESGPAGSAAFACEQQVASWWAQPRRGLHVPACLVVLPFTDAATLPTESGTLHQQDYNSLR